MAHFRVVVDSPLPAAEAWRRLWDLPAHSRLIPLTTLTGEPVGRDLRRGDRFVARTAVGPVGIDDVMVVEAIVHPRAGSPRGRALVRKTGGVVRGRIDAVVEARGAGSRIEWRQDIGIRGVPGVVDPVVSMAARAAYGHTIRRLLALVQPVRPRQDSNLRPRD